LNGDAKGKVHCKRKIMEEGEKDEVRKGRAKRKRRVPPRHSKPLLGVKDIRQKSTLRKNPIQEKRVS